MSRPPRRRHSPHPSSFVRINGRIRAREVRVIADENKQLGVLSIGEALKLAKRLGVDLVEVSGKATPPVCRLVDYGRYKYEQDKKKTENKKHNHSNKVKEVQLRPVTDPHDFHTKLEHAVDFLCDDMKVKVSLRFRGRENMHKDVGAETVQRFIDEIAPWGHPDAPPRSAGRMMSVMIAPLPRNKRAENPHPKHRRHEDEDHGEDEHHDDEAEELPEDHDADTTEDNQGDNSE